MSTSSRKILEKAGSVLLVDWPNTGVPRALLDAGLTVFGYSPGHYSSAAIVMEYPPDIGEKNIFPPKNENDSGYLIFRPISQKPPAVDIVNIFRPLEELDEIIRNHVVPLKAKVLWIQQLMNATEIRRAKCEARKHGLICVTGEDITNAAKLLINNKLNGNNTVPLLNDRHQ